MSKTLDTIGLCNVTYHAEQISKNAHAAYWLESSGKDAAHLRREVHENAVKIVELLGLARDEAVTKVPEGQTPLNDMLHHPVLDVINEGMRARDNGAPSPYHGHSLEHCLHASGWVQRDLRLALDAARRNDQPEEASK